jgi:hypothetical protein
MNKCPEATRPLEYVAFVALEIRIQEGSAYLFLAVDAYQDYVFNLGVERDRNPETVLKSIYFLMEDPEFAKHLGKGFTLVIEEFEELIGSIEAIIKPVDGKVFFNKSFNNVITNPVLLSLKDAILKSSQ